MPFLWIEMIQCIFCFIELTPDTKPEHILANALGGRATTRRVICSECNNRFGSTIDAALARQVQDLRGLLGLPSGDNKTAPPLQVTLETNQRLIVRPDGRIDIPRKPFTITKHEDGSFDVSITAKEAEHVNKIVPHVAASLGIPEENLWAQLVRADARVLTQPAPQVMRPMSFGGSDALRSLVKSCLVLWNADQRDPAILSARFDAARTFVKKSDQAFLAQSIQMDGRHIPGVEALTNSFGPIFNLIYIRSDDRGRVLAYIGLYNTVYWRVVVANEGGLPNRAVGLVSNPLHPSSWSYLPPFVFGIDFAWLETPTIDATSRTPEASLAVAFERRGEALRENHMREMLLETFHECGIKEGDLITQEAIVKFSMRLATWAIRTTSNRRLSEAEIRKMIRLDGPYQP